MKVDKSLTVPLYSQVEKILEEKIVSGQWKEGYQIPTESELATILDVSNITVKRAIINLVNKEMLYRQRGKGTFVAKTITEKNIYKSAFFTMENETSSSHKMLDEKIKEAQPFVAKKLNIDSGNQVVSIKRLGTENGQPVSIEYTYIPLSIFPENDTNINEDDFVYDILIKVCRKQLKYSKNYFSGTIANEEEAKIFNIKLHTPLFVWERITYSLADEPLEYSKFIMNQDKEKYYLEVPLV